MARRPDTSHLSVAADLARGLDEVATRMARARRAARTADAWSRGLREGVREAVLVAALGFLAALLVRAGGGALPSTWSLVLAVAAYPPLRAGLAVLRALRERPTRTQLLALADDRLGLHDRLVAAEEFARVRSTDPFRRAALRDGVAAARHAQAAPLALRREHAPVWLHAPRAVPLAAALLLATAWLEERPRLGGFSSADAVAAVGPTPAAAAATPPPEASVARAQPPAPTPDAARRSSPPSQVTAPTPRADEGELDRDEKPSSGRAGQGKGGEARGSSGASQARGAPTGQEPEASEPARSAHEPTARPEARAGDEPEPEDEEAEEDSGSTAGKGSSRGSNRNPVTSSWRSRDQVASEDDSEVEDDSDVDDDEEGQENRGGVQPSLRDRRPPTSRDLQIGFGNRASPDANGRGGPSQPKKSRGVASLVLGVPIPDRVKGRPGPGRTKITQERVEPEAEEAAPAPTEERTARRGPSGGPPPLDLGPDLRAVVRAYFLRARAEPPRE